MVPRGRCGTVARTSPACRGLDLGTSELGKGWKLGWSFPPADQGNRGRHHSTAHGCRSTPPAFAFLPSLSDFEYFNKGNGLIMMKTSFLLQPLLHALSAPGLFQLLVILPSRQGALPSGHQPPHSCILLLPSSPSL